MSPLGFALGQRPRPHRGESLRWIFCASSVCRRHQGNPEKSGPCCDCRVLDFWDVGASGPIIVGDSEQNIWLFSNGQEHGGNQQLLIADDGRRAPMSDCKRGGAEVVNWNADMVPRPPHGVWDRDSLLECCYVLATQEKFVAILTAVRSILFRPEEYRPMVLLQFGIGRLPETLGRGCPVIDDSFGKDLDLGI